MLKIAIADDQEYLRASIAETLDMFPEMELIHSSANGKAISDWVQNGGFADLILMDINMPILNGVEATRLIHEKNPSIKILMLTVFDEEQYIFDAIMAGASGYLLKDEKPEELHQAIIDVMEGGAPMSKSIALQTLKMLRAGGPSLPTSDENFDLTRREMDVLELIAVGQTYQEIAEKLFISPKTVRKHIENIYQKLRVHNKIEAVNLAKKHRLIP